MDPDVAQLVREQRLAEAARMASDRGDARGASAIYEQACEWGNAAAEAMRAGEAPRALELAVYGGDEALARQALAIVIRDVAMTENAAARLAHRGQHAWAARVLEDGGRPLDAARSWERAGDALRAAGLFENAGQAVDAARVLQLAFQREPGAWPVAVALGALLGRFGKWDAAVRLFQRVPADAAERREAVAGLVHAFRQLGLASAAQDAAEELHHLGATAATATKPQAVDLPSAEGGLLFARYRLVRHVASSAAARVLECFDMVRAERVALKWFYLSERWGRSREALARFEREVRAVASLRHEGVVTVRDFISEGPAVAVDWMAGGTLEQMLEGSEAIAPERAVEIAVAMFAALGAVHRIGILHRDVKPANVLFDEGGSARIGDFGVAHLVDVSVTVNASISATLAYQSPEQREGKPASAASDIYAVGAMLREMLTGEAPNPDYPPRLLPSQAHAGLDARHDKAVTRLTAYDPRARPTDASEARAVLAALPWPRASDSNGPRRTRQPAPLPAASLGRLEQRPDGVLIDRWMDRQIEQISLTEPAAARARAFALADHPALQAVWRADTTLGTLWLEGLGHHRLDRPLVAEERKLLREALDALHTTGATHGRVDRHHVVVDSAGRLILRFPEEDQPSASPDRDRQALDRL
ncbi:MAG: serine/threonine-protein kinase [Polyangiaceae bacterium]